MADYVRIFDDSFGRTAAKNPEFFDRFYARFLRANPTIEAKFQNTDFVKQREMLKKSLIELVSFFVSHKSTPYLEMLAAMHSKADRNIAPHLYDTWLRTLLETVADFDPEFEDSVALAWKVVLAPGIQFMKHHYDDAPVYDRLPPSSA